MVQSLSQIPILLPISHISNTLTFCSNIVCKWIFTGYGPVRVANLTDATCHDWFTSWMWQLMHGSGCEVPVRDIAIFGFFRSGVLL